MDLISPRKSNNTGSRTIQKKRHTNSMQISGLNGLEFKEEKNINRDLPNISYDQ